jgi:hypothetical protein
VLVYQPIYPNGLKNVAKEKKKKKNLKQYKQSFELIQGYIVFNLKTLSSYIFTIFKYYDSNFIIIHVFVIYTPIIYKLWKRIDKIKILFSNAYNGDE